MTEGCGRDKYGWYRKGLELLKIDVEKVSDQVKKMALYNCRCNFDDFAQKCRAWLSFNFLTNELKIIDAN